MTDSEHAAPNDATVAEDEREARSAHEAGRAADEKEAAAAEASRKEFEADAEDVARNVKSMNEVGADVKGEGEVR